MFTSVKRIVRSGFVGFWRNGFVSLSAIFVMTVTLLVVGGAILVSQLLNASLVQIQEKVDINVYMVTTAKEEDIMALKAALEALPGVAQVEYTSREVALAQFRDRHKNNELTIQALEELGENPLGASLAIRADETSQYESVNSFIQNSREREDPANPIIDRVNFNDNKAAIEKLTAIIDAVKQSTYMALLVLIIATVLISFNTIRLAIYTSREEIAVMRLVGASNMFIRGPFVLQGIMYGLISGVVALLILYPVVLWLGPATDSFFQFNIATYFIENFGHLFAVLVGSGVVLSMISGTFAIARYLRV